MREGPGKLRWEERLLGVEKRLKFLQARPFCAAATGELCLGCQGAASSPPSLKAALPLPRPLKTAQLRWLGWRPWLRMGLLPRMGFGEVLLVH